MSGGLFLVILTPCIASIIKVPRAEFYSHTLQVVKCFHHKRGKIWVQPHKNEHIHKVTLSVGIVEI